MTAINIPLEEYDELRQKAKAWDDHVRMRLEGGYVPSVLEILCISGQATIVINNRFAFTPFGKVCINADKEDTTFILQPGDRVSLKQEVKLSFNQ